MTTIKKIPNKPVHPELIESMTTKQDIEMFIRRTWKTLPGETLRICWMDSWENHYRLNFWADKLNQPKDRFFREQYIARSKHVVIKNENGEWSFQE